MKNRYRDTLYCGVRQDVIESAKPKLNEEMLKIHYEFWSERHAIFKKKEVEKLPAPWSDNTIFQQVKFTNTFRENDRESRNVINNICKKTDYSLKDRFFNIVLMRFWNKYESFKIATGGELLKFPLSDEDFKACNDRIAANVDHTWWSGAYYTCPVRSWLERVHFQKKIPTSDINFDQSPIYFAKYALTDEFWSKLESAANPKEFFEIFTAIPWMGKFLVYQFWVDLTYCEDYWFSENEFTISGPGCIKGLDLLFDDRDGMTHDECLFWLRDNQLEVYQLLGYNPQELFDDRQDHDRQLNVMALENTFCEVQKYWKCVQAIREGKKPRGKAAYNGTGVSNKKVKPKDKQFNLFDI